MLCHLQHQPVLSACHLQGIEDGGQILIELDIHNSTDDRYDVAVGDGRLGCWGNIAPVCVERKCNQTGSIILLKLSLQYIWGVWSQCGRGAREVS